MIDVHLLKLRARDDVSAEEERTLRDAVVEVRNIPADATAIRAGEELHHSTLLLEGWMGRVKDLHRGQRQMVELHIGGDFADLHSFTLKRLDHDVVTLTECKVALVPHERLKEITERYPHLTRVLWLMTNIDAAIHRERGFSLGGRSAIACMAHLFCELRVRLEVARLAQPDGYDFPLTQEELGQCLGLTGVHANRTLQELRRRSLIQLENRRLTILDQAGLERLGEFDPTYLYVEKRPR
jgi:CRP-like cAMP-binding protein